MQLTANGKGFHVHGNRKLIPSRQILLTMKFTVLLLITAALGASARSTAQVNLSEKKAKLEKVLQSIKKQSGYTLFYDDELVKQKGRPVDVDVRNVPVTEALKLVFRDQVLTYEIAGTTIIVKEKEVPKSVTGEAISVQPQAPPRVHGRVTDEKGEPVVGVSISIKGGKIVGVTDNNGEFVLNNVADDAVLVFSAVTIDRFEVKLNGRNELVLNAKTKISELEEVIVNKGYYTESKRKSVGNTATVKAADIEKQPVQNPLLALQGRVPGLVITQTNGLAGGGVKIRIQGQSSIQSGNDPLYVIDGVPYFSQLSTTGVDGVLGNSGGIVINGQQGQGSPLSYLNPADIESIDILKDADATAIYGSRAANGAILITTKQGKPGQSKADFKIQQGWGQVANEFEMMNRRQYLDMRYEALKNDGTNINTVSPTGTRYYDLKVWDTTRSTNWQKELIGNTAHYSNINGSLSGGNNNVRYLVGGTYHRETTVFPFGSDFSDQKFSGHFNLNTNSLDQKFRFQFSANYLMDDNKLPSTDLTQQALWLEPVAPSLYNADGTLNWAPASNNRSTWTNPMSYMYSKYRNKTNNLLSNAIISYQLFPNLEIKSSFGYNSLQTNDFRPTSMLAIKPENRPSFGRQASYGFRSLTSWVVEPQANFQTTIGKGKFGALLGVAIQQNNTNTYQINGSGYNSDLLLEDIRSAAYLSTDWSYMSVYKYNAIYGRVNYDWQDKYIINATTRRDGSSRFGEKSRYHSFYSVGVAWIFSNEKWLAESGSILSFGKLRGSYGTTGNDQIEDYKYLSLYNSIYGIDVPYQGTSSLEPSGISNPYLQWEETRKWQFGINLGFAHDRINLDVTYTRNRSSNQLLPYSLPTITGFQSITSNFHALVENTGWEFTLSTINISDKFFKWTSAFNLTVPKNKLVDFPGLESSTYAGSLIIGQPLNVQKTYHFAGVDPSTGLYVFANRSGGATSQPSYPDDYNVVLTTNQKYYGGLQNSVSFKSLEIDFLFQFVKQLGTPLFFNNSSAVAPGTFISGSSNQPSSVSNRWQAAGDNRPIQKYTAILGGPVAGQVSYASGSDANYSDASYIRLKNLSLTWQMPSKWVEKLHVQNGRLFLQCQNLLTITRYQGLDPETQGTSLPPLRTITAGLKFGL